jgi:hypothetical protein
MGAGIADTFVVHSFRHTGAVLIITNASVIRSPNSPRHGWCRAVDVVTSFRASS